MKRRIGGVESDLAALKADVDELKAEREKPAPPQFYGGHGDGTPA